MDSKRVDLPIAFGPTITFIRLAVLSEIDCNPRKLTMLLFVMIMACPTRLFAFSLWKEIVHLMCERNERVS
jgi:hypothetical protein